MTPTPVSYLEALTRGGRPHSEASGAPASPPEDERGSLEEGGVGRAGDGETV